MYIDSGASHYMTCVREHFTSLTQREIDRKVVLGDDSTQRAIGIGNVSF